MKIFNILNLIISLIAIFGMSLSIYEINVNQVSGQTNDNLNMTSLLKTSSENDPDTFDMNGAISSLIFVPDTITNNSTILTNKSSFTYFS
ncbi:MAG TPA: hypothetical protein VFP49_12110 [Nitrososphaeraceae archaeon]|nr:hypothetical protein [Nitrososphaeraceae archaeon]